MSKNNKIIIIIGAVLFLSLLVFTISLMGEYSKCQEMLARKEEEVKKDPLSFDDVPSLKNLPVISGNVLDIIPEENLITVLAYDNELKKDTIYPARITNETLFIIEDEGGAQKEYRRDDFYNNIPSDIHIYNAIVTPGEIENNLPNALVVMLSYHQNDYYLNPFEL